ncbi:12729_t:CDS:2 [Entrophospora sp. SA101]|nr:12729_t:CDS:2 [Entrophospora sp. SA101]
MGFLPLSIHVFCQSDLVELDMARVLLLASLVGIESESEVINVV